MLCLTSFIIPANFMELTLQWDDGVLENRLILGTRLFNIFSTFSNEIIYLVQSEDGVSAFSDG